MIDDISKCPSETRRQKSAIIIAATVFCVLLLDQILKIWIKTSFYIGESREITPWFSLTFVENNGMAFGWSVGSKIFLTLFRIIFVGLLAFGLIKACKKRSATLSRGFLICIALILAGAVGNIIDCVFYGVIFNNPVPPEVATMFSGNGYGLFEGRVVDMLSFHFFSFDWPSWIPLIGSKHFDFFGPVFNIADAAISVGVAAMIIFYRKQISPFLCVFKRGYGTQLTNSKEKADK